MYGYGRTALEQVQGLERKREVCVQVRCWEWRETERRELADVFEVVNGVCVVPRRKASGLFTGMVGAVRERSTI